MTTDNLITYFDQYLPLDDPEKDEIRTHAVERRIKRKQFILQANDSCRYYTFVVTGCFKMYSVDRKGTEHNLQFAAENDRIGL